MGASRMNDRLLKAYFVFFLLGSGCAMWCSVECWKYEGGEEENTATEYCQYILREKMQNGLLVLLVKRKTHSKY